MANLSHLEKLMRSRARDTNDVLAKFSKDLEEAAATKRLLNPGSVPSFVRPKPILSQFRPDKVSLLDL